jgi:hypothetical protein
LRDGRRFAVALLLVGSAGAVAKASAQTMADASASRQLHGESRLDARIDYAAGTLHVAPSDAATLYRIRLRYDRDRYTPLARYSAADGRVVLGVEATGGAGLRVSNREHLAQDATVALSPKVDLALDVTLGATEGELELGGLRLRNVSLRSGASRTVVRFSRPNGTRCARARFSSGAAELEVTGLGNSRCAEIVLDGGIGKVTLDFTGEAAGDAKARLRMALGELVLRVPRAVGLRLTGDRRLASLETAGLVRQGDAYVSPNYGRAARHLDVTATSTLGGITVEWLP